MTSILDPFYSIIYSFFPTALIQIPFFNFCINIFFFAFCCWIFSIFLIYPLKSVFDWFRRKLRG